MSSLPTNSPSTTQETTSPSTPMTMSSFIPQSTTVKGWIDPTWGHCVEDPDPNTIKVKIVCLYCQESFVDGGIHRFKKYFVGQWDNPNPYKKVLANVRY